MTTTDARPGTVPSWAIRVAYDGEEWLVLTDLAAARASHRCGGDRAWYMPARYRIVFGTGWLHQFTHDKCDGPYLDTKADGWQTADSLAEAHAAFDRIEAAWRERER